MLHSVKPIKTHGVWEQNYKRQGHWYTADPPPCLCHRGSLYQGVRALLLGVHGLPWDVWVLQHKTVNLLMSDKY